MGLDSVEIVVEVEYAFGIRIPDREAENILTVGDFHNLVWRYVKDRKEVHCKSQNVFYRLRAALADSANIRKEKIGTDILLSDIVPKQNRRELWAAMSERTALKLPELVLPSPYSIIVPILGVTFNASVILTSLTMILRFNYSWWTILIPILTIYLALCVSRLLDPKRKHIKQKTFRDFAEKVISINYKSNSLVGKITRKEVELIINKIIADKAGLDLDEVTPGKKICHDLGID